MSKFNFAPLGIAAFMFLLVVSITGAVNFAVPASTPSTTWTCVVNGTNTTAPPLLTHCSGYVSQGATKDQLWHTWYEFVIAVGIFCLSFGVVVGYLWRDE